MSARFDRPRRRSVPNLLVASLAGVAAFLSGCSKGAADGSALELTPAAMRSLPSLRSSASTSALAALLPGPDPSSIADHRFVRQLFAMECRQTASGVNYCPPGTPAPPRDAFDPYQFTMQTLIGFIYHAQMYSSLVTECSGEGLTPAAVGASSYASASTSPSANPTRFVLDQFSTYTCRSEHLGNKDAETRVVSSAADGSYQTTLHTRYAYDAGDGRPQTDFFQVDVSLDGGTPVFLAFNFASAAPFRSRLVLLANLSDHRFALKYLAPSQPGDLGSSWAPERFAVAAGVGGFDLSTGASNAGHYYVDFLDEPNTGEERACVNNVGAAFESDASPCDAEAVPTGWTGSAAIGAYLRVPPAHASRLAPFLAMFESAAPLGASEAWQAMGDDELYWPKSLR